MNSDDDQSDDRLEINAPGGTVNVALDGDVYVNGDGTPVYRLFEHRQARKADPQWLRRQPSRMLDARAEIVTFTGRATELGELIAWRDAAPRFAVRLLHGEGGQGKTRLAAQLATDSERGGWKVVDAVHHTDANPSSGMYQDLRIDGHRGVLLLADYADRWPLSDLKWLFHNTLLWQGVPTRVLLIGRSDDMWPALCGALDQLRANIESSVLQLPPLPGDGPGRGQMFAAARDSFALLYKDEVKAPSEIEPPMNLAEIGFGLTLTLHMAALVAVDAAAIGQPSPKDMAGLTTYLLNREQENWRQLHDNAVRGLGYETPDVVMARMAFTAILTGSMPRASAAIILGKLMPGTPADQALSDHAVCYPSDSPDTVLEPMVPDRLAEDFLALMIPGHTVTGVRQDPWAVQVAGRLLTMAESGNCAPRAVTFLASSADRWPHVGEVVLYPLLRDTPEIAVEAGSQALTVLARIGDTAADIDSSLLETLNSIEEILPHGRHVDLDLGMLAVAERLTAFRLARTIDPALRARLLGNLVLRRGNAGLWQPALQAAEEAVRTNRDLSKPGDRHLSYLATSLDNLSDILSRFERSGEALALAREAVDIRRDLAAADPGQRSALASALDTLGIRLADSGRDEEALAVAEDVVMICREMNSNLAVPLNNLALYLRAQGRREESLAAMEEAASAFRQLAAEDPDVHLIDLAASANNLGAMLADLGRHDQAASVFEDGVRRYRQLVVANPVSHRPGLVMALHNLGTVLAEGLGRPLEAIALFEEAIVISRQLAETDPVVHRIGLARALSGLGRLLSQTGQCAEAIAAFDDASGLYIQSGLVANHVDAEHTEVLRDLSDLYRDVGDRAKEGVAALNLCAQCFMTGLIEEGIEAGRRAASICRETGDWVSEVSALINLGGVLGDVGRADEAVAACERAADISRKVGAIGDEAEALTILGKALIDAGRYSEAVAACARARDIATELGGLGDRC